MKRFKQKNSKLGFTLIELLIVIAIIGILVVIVVTAINPIRVLGEARDSRRRADLTQIKTALQLYYNDCKAYPATAAFNAIFGSAFGSTGNGFDGTAGTCDDGVVYMKQVPSDSTGSYVYTQVNGGTDYNITAYINYPKTDDTNSLSKCSVTGNATIKFAVCND